MSPEERERRRRFLAERRRQVQAGVRIQRDTFEEIRNQLRIAERRIRAALAGTPSEYQSWRLDGVRAEIRRAMASWETDTWTILSLGLDKSWQAGSDLVTEPLRAGGIDLTGRLQALDIRVLDALKALQTDRIRDISTTATNQVNTELTQAALGVQTPFEAASKVSSILQAPEKRARMIVRTELGTVYSEAGQQRMEQAVAIGVGGLQKIWRRSGKLHPRLTHDLADGQIVDVDKPFMVGGIPIPKPRDPSIPPKERINCGCASLPHMAHWRLSTPGVRGYSASELATSQTARQVEEIRAAPPSNAPPSNAPPWRSAPPAPPAVPPQPPGSAGAWPWPAHARATEFQMTVDPDALEFGFFDSIEEARGIAAQLTAGIPEEVSLAVGWRADDDVLHFHAEGRGALMMRTFRRSDERVEVDHTYFAIATSHQGGGHARRMLQASLHAYDALGVSRITVHADIDVGGYAWARSGFAMNDDAIDEYRDGLVEAADQLPPSAGQLLLAVVNSSPDFRLMYDVARLLDGTTPIGKRLLLHSDWYGHADLESGAHRALLAEALSG